MPVDVVIASCSSYLQQTTDTYWNPEEMSGSLTLVGPNKHCQQVNIKVYRTSVEHFAVLYPQKKVCRPLGVLNLRNTQIERLHDGFVVRQRGFDSPMCLTFITESPKELDSWIVAFTCKTAQNTRHCSLPIVEEDEEV